MIIIIFIQKRGHKMEQFIGVSSRCDVDEAVKGLSNPKLIIMFVSDEALFEKNVLRLKEKFPDVPSISCVGQSYAGNRAIENGLLITALCGDITVDTGVIQNVSKAPVASIRNIQNSISKVNAGKDNTVIIDLCTGNDECVLTTIQSVIAAKGIQLTGGTTWTKSVGVNGNIYEDSCAYAVVKNNKGRVKVYRENIYTPTDKFHICTKAVPNEYKICDLDGKKAQDVYINELGIKPQDVEEQTFKNPLGRCLGDEIFIVSIKEKSNNGDLYCYRKVNPKDKLYILEAGDDKEILEDIIRNIQSDFSHISGVFSINCIFRYLYFKKLNHIDNYLNRMSSLGKHSGFIGMGEHFNGQHTNQTMSCVVFE